MCLLRFVSDHQSPDATKVTNVFGDDRNVGSNAVAAMSNPTLTALCPCSSEKPLFGDFLRERNNGKE